MNFAPHSPAYANGHPYMGAARPAMSIIGNQSIIGAPSIIGEESALDKVKNALNEETLGVKRGYILAAALAGAAGYLYFTHGKRGKRGRK